MLGETFLYIFATFLGLAQLDLQLDLRRSESHLQYHGLRCCRLCWHRLHCCWRCYPAFFLVSGHRLAGSSWALLCWPLLLWLLFSLFSSLLWPLLWPLLSLL